MTRALTLLFVAACSGGLPTDRSDAGPDLPDAPTHDGGAEGVDASVWGDAGEDASRVWDAGRDAAADDAGRSEDAGRGEDAGEDGEDAGMAPSPVVERTYRTLHWNIAGGKENACATFGITRAVRRFTVDRDADFVGLNEVCPAQFESIREALRRAWGLGPREKFAAFVPDGVGRIVGNAIYSRHGLRGVTRDRVGEDRYGARNLLCGRVPGLRLRFCSTHLTPADPTARRQLERVMDRVEGWWMRDRATVILSGDLNLHANDVGLDAVYASGANTRNNPNNRGAYREVDDDDPDHCRGYGERTLPGTAGGPCREGGKIDFVFVRGNRIVDGNYGGDTFNVPSDCTGRCSDHRPLLGRTRLRVRRE